MRLINDYNKQIKLLQGEVLKKYNELRDDTLNRINKSFDEYTIIIGEKELFNYDGSFNKDFFLFCAAFNI